MPDKLSFIYSRLTVKVFDIVYAVFDIRIYCKIPDAKGCKIMKKMSALAWVNPVMLKT